MSSQTEQMQREIQSLTDKLAAAKIGAGGGAKRKKAVATGFVPAIVNTGSSGGSRKRRRKKGNLGANAGQGVITFSRKEKVCDVDIGASQTGGSGNFDLVPKSFTFLKKFTMFDKVKWNKIVLFYKPGVGATFNGFVSYGVLWDFSAKEADRAKISALTPNMSHALWYDGQMTPLVLPQSKLQTRPWFSVGDDKDIYETGPGRVFWASSTTDTTTSTRVVGEIWADYSITMTGTTF
ncbi:MAG: hypothetical protein [Ixodes ricinus sobemo-like virus 1]|nr:MAG: hypothetical protein [Ixodes ricinus sobemo-like virus 1]